MEEGVGVVVSVGVGVAVVVLVSVKIGVADDCSAAVAVPVNSDVSLLPNWIRETTWSKKSCELDDPSGPVSAFVFSGRGGDPI